MLGGARSGLSQHHGYGRSDQIPTPGGDLSSQAWELRLDCHAPWDRNSHMGGGRAKQSQGSSKGLQSRVTGHTRL